MKNRQNRLKKLALLLAATLLLGGCGSAEPSEETPVLNEQNAEQSSESGNGKETEQASESSAGENLQGTEDAELVDELKKKYSAADKNEYNGDVIKVDRNKPIEIELGYNPMDSDVSPYDSFTIYQDADLKFQVDVGNMDYNADTGILTIEPPYSGIAEIMESDGVDLSGLKGNYLSGDGESAWGTLSQYYMKTSVDLQTGKALAAPVITVIKVNAEIPQAPQLVFNQLDDGYARFSWKAVPGADGYLLFKINKDDKGLWNYCYAFANVKGTEWTSQKDDVTEYEGKILSINYRFVQYYTSEDTAEWMEDEGAFLKEFVNGDVAYDEYWEEYYGVLAYNAKGCSPISNLLSAKDVSHMLPTEKATYSNEGFFGIHGVADLPAVMNVTMCDGSRAQKVLLFDFDKMEKDEEYNAIRVTGKALQTPFTNEFSVYDVNWDTLDADIAALKKRQDELINKGGNVAPSLTIDEGTSSKEEETKQEESKPEEAKPAEDKKTEEEKPENTQTSQNGRKEVKVTANSAMSEYIAMNMLETKRSIDLSGFPEAADVEQVVDAFFEAQYQNPLVLGVQGGSIDTENRILFVDYDFDPQVTAAKQEEILERVSQITDEIISDGMTDAEKEMAINTWLCDNASYDHAALANAEKYSFTQVDEDFYDSFTAYGILTGGVGVCASYSASFKLLADAADLESIVVTGYLDGSTPHAWNKVKLEDEWYIVDSTNNDNDTIENALLNLSDRAAYGTLVENNNFVMDGNLSDYAAGAEDEEYYRVTDRFYDKDEVSEQLAQLLTSNGTAVLRTDYNIDDETFYTIAQDAANMSGKNISGFYWMGVIHLEE